MAVGKRIILRLVLFVGTLISMCWLLRYQVWHQHGDGALMTNMLDKTKAVVFNASAEKVFVIPPDDVLRSLNEKAMILLYWSLSVIRDKYQEKEIPLYSLESMCTCSMFKSHTRHVEMQGIAMDKYVNTLQILCQNQMRHGSLWDGGKEICIDEEFVPRKPCLVYSFGSQLRFDFEESILRAYGCEIHTFDPSVTIDASNRQRIPVNVSYHEIGLGGRDYVTRGGWTIRTLPTIIRQLKHQNRIIDILKIDAEGGEWNGFKNIRHFRSLKNVKQLCIELHFGLHSYGKKAVEGDWEFWGGVPTMQQLRILRTFYEMGFRVFMREHTMSHILDIPTVYGPKLCSINEISLVNIKWKI